MTAAPTSNLRASLDQVLALLSDDEVAAVLAVSEALALGRGVKGLYVDANRRDFPHDGDAELCNALVYIGRALVRQQRGRS